jgi:hypothetical protein
VVVHFCFGVWPEETPSNNLSQLEILGSLPYPERTEAYEYLDLARRGEQFRADELARRFRNQRMDMLLSVADVDDVMNLRELAIKYYQDPKYWRLITWSNPTAFGGEVSQTASVQEARLPLYIIRFISRPRYTSIMTVTQILFGSESPVPFSYALVTCDAVSLEDSQVDKCDIH